MAKQGTRENPWLVAPDDWHTNGVPYGDFCKCDACNLIARSTFSFDYYADAPGQPLRCESCKLGRHRDMHKITDAIAAKIIAEDN